MPVPRHPYPANGLAYAQQGDTVDLICQRYYGRTGTITERVLEENRGLADLGPILPMGTEVKLPRPDTLEPETPKLTQLWD